MGVSSTEPFSMALSNTIFFFVPVMCISILSLLRSAGRVSVIRPCGAVGGIMALQLYADCMSTAWDNVSASGKRDAVWPSSPMPSITKLNGRGIPLSAAWHSFCPMWGDGAIFFKLMKVALETTCHPIQDKLVTYIHIDGKLWKWSCNKLSKEIWNTTKFSNFPDWCFSGNLNETLLSVPFYCFIPPENPATWCRDIFQPLSPLQNKNFNTFAR